MIRSKTVNNGGKWELKIDVDSQSDLTTLPGTDELLENVYGRAKELYRAESGKREPRLTMKEHWKKIKDGVLNRKSLSELYEEHKIKLPLQAVYFTVRGYRPSDFSDEEFGRNVRDLYNRKADVADFTAEKYSALKNWGLAASLLDGAVDFFVIPVILSRWPRWIPVTMMAIPNIAAAGGLALAYVEKNYEHKKDLMKSLSEVPHYVRFEPNSLLFSLYK